MAITGTKLFASGDVLTANDTNQYLMRGVKVFSSTAVRDAAYGGAGEPTLEEGETCYITATDELQVYDGASWAVQQKKSSTGLIVVKAKTSFSTASTITVDNVFTDDYLNYMIDLNFTKSTSLTVNFQERVGGVTAATAYYMAGLASEYTANTTLYFPRSNNATAAGITLAGGSNGTFVRLFLYAPKTTYKTGLEATHIDDSGYSYQIGGLHAVATAYDGFILTTSTGTITGSYTIYGLGQ